MMVYLHNKSQNNPIAGKAEIIIGKQRNGPVDTVKRVFKKAWPRVPPLTLRDDEPVHREAM
jgi:replicative DNA helicase